MKRIVIFGDSFCADKLPSRIPWTSFITNTGKYEIVNFAIHGSSTEYSLRKFVNFIRDKLIKPDDTIIFQTSTIGRLDFWHQETHPNTSTMYQPWNAIHLQNDMDHSWYYESEEHIKWFIVNRNDNTLCFNQTSYLHLIKSFAENNPTNTVILLKNTDPHDYTIPFNNFPSNLFVPDVDLNKISTDELIACDILEFVTKYTKFDVRENHLTLPNRKKLAEAMMEVIENRTTENFTYDRFHKNIIKPLKNRHDYERYIALGLLEENDMIDHYFTK